MSSFPAERPPAPQVEQPLEVLALEPYYGGSHRAFLDGWIERSRHRWTVLDLPPYKWKWRMRHGAMTLAEEAARRVAADRRWDVLFCSDMLDLAQFRGLAPAAIHRLPAVAYFHENQLTYPVRRERERDLHFAMTNLTTALAADQVWFNSAFHRDDFLAALAKLATRMPDFKPHGAVASLGSKSHVQSPGICAPKRSETESSGPLRILWAARWEHDKNPETFFDALAQLGPDVPPFRVSVVGESFRDVPPIFEQARVDLGDRIERWGYLESRRDYENALLEADLFVSTSNHEFFGISAAEAMAAGAYPLLPNRLAYPELLGNLSAEQRGPFLYSGDAKELAARLRRLAEKKATEGLWQGLPPLSKSLRRRLGWRRRALELDHGLEAVATKPWPRSA